MVDTDKNTVIEASIDERARHLLKVLIERYIREGQPVGSRTLAHDSGLNLSPATIRNVMADLEELGFLHSPHTSAGRIPTARGYRFFVDSLMQIRPLPSQEVQELQRQLEIDPYLNTTSLVQSVSSLLSAITKMAGVVMVPRHNNLALRQVEFLPLSDNRVLAILVVNEREVQNRIIHTQRTYAATELKQAANFLNARFVGKDIRQVRKDLVDEIHTTRETMNQMMETVVEMAQQAFGTESIDDEDYVLEGQTNLMSFAELSDLEKLRQLFEAFTKKHDILHLLDQCLHAQGLQIFIGEESGFNALEECSVVTAPYSVDGKILGVLGVIGPTRMAYQRVIPLVDVTARLLASALNSRN